MQEGEPGLGPGAAVMGTADFPFPPAPSRPAPTDHGRPVRIGDGFLACLVYTAAAFHVEKDGKKLGLNI